MAVHKKRTWRTPRREKVRRPRATPSIATPARVDPSRTDLARATTSADPAITALGLLSSPPFNFLDRCALVLVAYPPRTP